MARSPRWPPWWDRKATVRLDVPVLRRSAVREKGLQGLWRGLWLGGHGVRLRERVDPGDVLASPRQPLRGLRPVGI
ncbi:MAG: hypothetical protein QOI89_2365 [Solirubrobacteraceae bacterium]|jgi:hypothetical protein|nr:hypothetical protein [Solirubrobacteraceae bacterium]